MKITQEKAYLRTARESKMWYMCNVWCVVCGICVWQFYQDSFTETGCRVNKIDSGGARTIKIEKEPED